jgi:hypothetical protein
MAHEAVTAPPELGALRLRHPIIARMRDIALAQLVTLTVHGITPGDRDAPSFAGKA